MKAEAIVAAGVVLKMKEATKLNFRNSLEVLMLELVHQGPLTEGWCFTNPKFTNIFGVYNR